MSIAEQAQALQLKIKVGIRRLFTAIVPKESAWEFDTSGAVSSGVSLFKIIGGSVSDGVIVLKKSDSDEKINLLYCAAGPGVGFLGPPVNATWSPMSAPQQGTKLYIMPGSDDFKTAADFMVPGMTIGPVVMLAGDVGFAFEGTGCVMFLGVASGLSSSLKRLAAHSHALQALAGQKMPDGIWASATQVAHLQWDITKIEADVVILLAQLYTRGVIGSIRGVLATAGMQAGVASGAGLTAYFGVVHEIAEGNIPGVFTGPQQPEAPEPLPPEVEKQMYTPVGDGLEVPNWDAFR